jgi:preprotein translocase subunit SecF
MRGRNATPGVLAVGIALIMIGVSLTLRSEAQRATAVLIAAGSIGYAWVRLRN